MFAASTLSAVSAQWRCSQGTVDVGVAQLEQGQMTVVSVSIPVWVWLAALSVARGRVPVGWWSGWRLPRTYSTASGVMT
jgi:hypothetical protein